jgi:hypothetical protein
MFIEHQFVEAQGRAIALVIERWKQNWPSMSLLALLPEAEKTQVALVQDACRAQEVSLHGAIFPALIDSEGFRSHGVLLICMGTTPGSFLLEEVQEEGATRFKAAIEDLMRATPAIDDSRGTLFTIFDAMLPHIGTLLNDTHAYLLKAPRYIGVNAGSESFQSMPCLFNNDRLVQNGVLGLYFPKKMNSAVHHAYEESDIPFRATSATGNRIVKIDGQPAFAAYQKIIWEQYAVELTKENFYDYAVHFPFGLVTAMDVLVRIPVGLGDDDSIVCVGEIAANSMLRLLKAPALSESLCAQDIGVILQSNTVETVANSLLIFYCAGRRMHFDADAATELKQIHSATGHKRMYGALSLGEIDTLDDFECRRASNIPQACAPSEYSGNVVSPD